MELDYDHTRLSENVKILTEDIENVCSLLEICKNNTKKRVINLIKI